MPPPIHNDNAEQGESSDSLTRPVPPDGLHWWGSVRQFRWMLLLQQAVLAGDIGGPNDGGKPDR